MTIYDLLDTLIRAARMSEPAERDALALVDDLRRTSALGTLASREVPAEHAPQYPPMSNVCSICQKGH